MIIPGVREIHVELIENQTYLTIVWFLYAEYPSMMEEKNTVASSKMGDKKPTFFVGTAIQIQ